MRDSQAEVTKEGRRRAYRAQIAEKDAIIKQLRERLEMDEPQTVELWEILPQEMRDEMATRAIFQMNAHATHALTMLGFAAPKNRHELADMTKRIFGTPGVQERLRRNISDADAMRTNIVARQTEIALNGNNDQATRSASVLSRLAGWEETPPPPQQGGTVITGPVHLWNLVDVARADKATIIQRADPNREVSVLDVLNYEPGAPIRIDSNSEDIDMVFEALEGAPGDDDDGVLAAEAQADIPEIGIDG